MTALAVGDLVTVRPLAPKTVERQRGWQQGDQFSVGGHIVIRQPFNYVGVAMTVEELHRDFAYCHVHDLHVRLSVMNGKTTAQVPRKYLRRIQKGESCG